MTYVSVVTIVAYALLVAGLAVVSVKDARTRRIPNGWVALLMLLWAAWRLVLGFAGKYMGLGFWSTLLSPAPEVLGRFGLPIYGVSLSEGILGALALGGGMLVLSAVYELAMRNESFGGGDIKLMAVVGLFLGWERGLVCLLVACVLSVAYVLVRAVAARARRASAPNASGDSAAAPLRTQTMPFAPFITLGVLVAFVS